jgi:hypothetical protein
MRQVVSTTKSNNELGGRLAEGCSRKQCAFVHIDDLNPAQMGPSWQCVHSPRAIRLKAHSFPKDYMICRLCYINHPPVAGATADAMQQKFAKEEANSVHITYPKFTAVFIPGLILSPISWIVQKGKGRLIVDKACQGGHRTSQCARTTPGGGLFLRRHLSAVWNMRIAHPREDLRSGCIVSSGRRQ